MVGKVVTLRLNKFELEKMEEISKREGKSVGRCIKDAMKAAFFEEFISQELIEKMESSKESHHWQLVMDFMISVFTMVDKTDSYKNPDFLNWLLANNSENNMSNIWKVWTQK